MRDHAFRIRPRARASLAARLHLAAGRLLAEHHRARRLARAERSAGLVEDAARLDGRANGVALALLEIERVSAGDRR